MVNNYRFAKNLLALATASLVIGQAYAANDKEAVTLENVTVTASGHLSDELQTPHAVTVADQELIESTGADNVGQLLKGQPGISLTADGAWGANPVLRGLSKERLVILVDGMRLNSAQPYGAVASLIGMQQIERVEVVKGPVSVLYGSGAMGGVINFITPKADFTQQTEFGGNATLAASSADKGARGAVSLVASNQRHALNLSVSGERLDDYESGSGQEVKHTGYDQWALAANYRLKTGDIGFLEVNLQNQKDDDVWYPGSVKPHPAHITRTIHSPEQERTLYELAYNLELDSSWQPEFRANVFKQDVRRTIYAFSERFQRDVVRTDVTFATLGSGLKLILRPNEKHTLSMGLDGWKMTGDPERYMDTNPPLFDNNMRYDPFSEAEITSLGMYLQDEWLVQRWSVKAGVRYDQIEADADSAVGLPAGTRFDSNDFMFSWSLGGVYHVSDMINPYLSVSRAHRAADMRERFESSPRGDGFMHQGNPNLDPEQNTTFELGLKGASADVRYSIGVYQSTIKDYIIGRVTGANSPQGLPIKATENLAEVTITGMEAEIEKTLADSTYAFAWLSYLKGENEYDDEPLMQMPAPELTLGLRHAPQLGLNWDVSARMVKEQDRIGKKLSNNREDETEGFVTADAGVGYRFMTAGLEHSARLAVTNIFDRHYHEHLAEGISGNEPDAIGRNIRLSWNSRF